MKYIQPEYKKYKIAEIIDGGIYSEREIIEHCKCLKQEAHLNSETVIVCLSKTYCIFITKNSRLIVFRQIIVVYS